jgi:hypothetical protein
MSDDNTPPAVSPNGFALSDGARQLIDDIADILTDPEVAQACQGKGEAEIRDILWTRAGPLFAKFKRENNVPELKR